MMLFYHRRTAARRGFTLIELLIVVAIIAVLAAIALPNLLEAQTRSKVSRIKSDQRSLAIAFEAYSADSNGKYPFYGNHKDHILPPTKVITYVPGRLTTPLAYITALPDDIFPNSGDPLMAGQSAPFYYMHNYAESYLGKDFRANHIEEHYRTLTGSDRPVQWTVWSFGPDLKDNHGTLLYDPTNGTVSSGDMMRFGP